MKSGHLVEMVSLAFGVSIPSRVFNDLGRLCDSSIQEVSEVIEGDHVSRETAGPFDDLGSDVI